MKRTILILAILPLLLLAPVISGNQVKANAAVNIQKALDIMGSDEATATIEEIVKVGTELKQGNTDTLKKAVFKKALEQAGIKGEVNEFIIANIKDVKIGSDGVSKIITKNAESIAKNQLKKHLNERLHPYQDKIAILSLILGAQNQ